MMEKKMLKRSLAVWMVLVLLFICTAPVALMEGETAVEPSAEETVADTNIINEESEQLLDETQEMVDNVTTEESSVETTNEETVAEPTEETASEDVTPTAEEPAAEETTEETPAAEEPTAEETTEEAPAAEEPAAEETTEEAPAAEEPATEETTGEAPAAEEPATEESTEEAPAAEEPTAEETTEEAPAVEEPAAEECTEEAPAVEEPAAEETTEEAPAVEESAAEETTEEAPVVLEIRYVDVETDIRLAPDGLSEIIVTVPAETELNVYEYEGNWAKVDYYDAELGLVVGYVYCQPEDTSAMAVVIFTSRRSVMTPGETVYLTSQVTGFDGYEISYQWQCDMGNGFVDVEGATSDTWSFSASVETLSYDWRLAIYYR